MGLVQESVENWVSLGFPLQIQSSSGDLMLLRRLGVELGVPEVGNPGCGFPVLQVSLACL